MQPLKGAARSRPEALTAVHTEMKEDPKDTDPPPEAMLRQDLPIHHAQAEHQIPPHVTAHRILHIQAQEPAEQDVLHQIMLPLVQEAVPIQDPLLQDRP